jgi:nuclear pore complex protein Nup205
MSTMSDSNSLESLQALYADLLAFSEGRLVDLDRLEFQLGAHVQDLRNLLDKKTRNEQSRQTLASGTEAHAEYCVSAN